MKIGFYHDAAGTRHAGGIAVYTQQMAAALSRSNDVYLYTQEGDLSPLLTESDVTVIETPSFKDHWTQSLDPVHQLGPQNRVKLLMAQWAIRNGLIDHMNEHLDILFTYQFLDDLLLSNVVDVPTVYTFHRLTGFGLGVTLRDKLSQTEHLLANSDETAKRVTDALDSSVERLIYPGVDADRFQPGVEPAISSDDPIILFVGRLVESKGIYDLLEAVSRLEGEQELHFVGRGGEKAQLQRRARELGMWERVELHGEVPHPELPAYHAGADVFCLPSHNESFGMANVEAMACELPVVTTALEGVKTYLVNGENGLLARVNDPQDLADKLTMVLESPELRDTLGRQAREDIQAFTWREQARRLEQFCYDAVDRSEPAEPAHREPVEMELDTV